MIIECRSCHARFRLDESRIKGRGARVKCRKCGAAIIVLKDDPSASLPKEPVSPPAAPVHPGDGGFFDLESALRESPPGAPATQAPPSTGNLIPFPGPARPADAAVSGTAPVSPPPPLQEPAAPAREPVPEKDEVDLAFERFLSGGEDVPPPGETGREPGHPETPGAGGAAEDKAASVPEPSFGAGTGEMTLDFLSAAPTDSPPAETVEAQSAEPPGADLAPGFRGEGGFLLSDSESLDFLREERQPQETPKIGDISMEISATPGGEVQETRDAQTPLPPPVDFRTPAPVETPFEGNATPVTPAGMTEAPPRREPETASAPAAEPSAAPERPRREAPRARSSAVPAVAAIAAILVAAGGYLGFTESGRKTLEGVVPGAAALWGGKPAAPAGAKFDLRNVIGYYESGASSPRILVIKGQVANLSGAEKSGIRVVAALLDNTDRVLAQTSVYAGNVLTGEAIRKADRETISKTLGNRFGEGLANMHVAPDKSIPFMVVFFDAPENIDSYKLEAKENEP